MGTHAAEGGGVQPRDNDRHASLAQKRSTTSWQRLGSRVVLARGDGYFYFWGGKQRTGSTARCVPTLHSLNLEQGIEQSRMLREKDRALMKGPIQRNNQGIGQEEDPARCVVRIIDVDRAVPLRAFPQWHYLLHSRSRS